MMMMMTIYKVQIGSCCNSMLIALRKKKRKKGEKKKNKQKGTCAQFDQSLFSENR